MPTRSQFRSQLVSHSLFPKTTLKKAIDRLGFVQADPIRSPARCQDLILRHRVKNYKAGDLERRYPALDLEEDYTFAYGFLPGKNRNFVHPRSGRNLSKFEKLVIATVGRLGPSTSGDLEEYCGNKCVRNAWGGSSKATKQALEAAHHLGYLRVARRKNGIRMYESAPQVARVLAPAERFRKLLLMTVNLFGPTSQAFLLSELRHLYPVRKPLERKKVLESLIEEGKLYTLRVGDTEYVANTARVGPVSSDSVKVLSPFDPIVRDRDRFERLWGWAYRFEAYTPAARRVRGYYAMPVLWQNDVIGWANATVSETLLTVEVGYERRARNVRRFKSALEKEISDLATFLHLEPDAWRLARHPRSK